MQLCTYKLLRRQLVFKWYYFSSACWGSQQALWTTKNTHRWGKFPKPSNSFEAFLLSIKLSANLLFLKSVVLWWGSPHGTPARNLKILVCWFVTAWVLISCVAEVTSWEVPVVPVCSLCWVGLVKFAGPLDCYGMAGFLLLLSVHNLSWLGDT